MAECGCVYEDQQMADLRVEHGIQDAKTNMGDLRRMAMFVAPKPKVAVNSCSKRYKPSIDLSSRC